MDQPTQTTEQVWPERPLEDYLAELRETGFTVLDNLVDQNALARIVAATDARIPELDPAPPEFDGRIRRARRDLLEPRHLPCGHSPCSTLGDAHVPSNRWDPLLSPASDDGAEASKRPTG